MADKESSRLPVPSADDVKVASGHFEYANRAAAGGNFDIAIQMLRTSCRLMPGHLAYRQTLRKYAKTKYKDNKRGSALAPLTTFFPRMSLTNAYRRGQHLKVLDHGEAILAKNPWDKMAQLWMAEAAAALDLPVLAVWILQQAREKDAKDVQVNRALAKLLEKQGHFNQAIQLWNLVRQVLPTDQEALDKSRQLAVTDTIARGNYEDAVENPGMPTGSGEQKAVPAGGSPLAGSAGHPVLGKKPQKEKAADEAEALQARLEAAPQSPETYLQLAAHKRRHGHLDEAKAVLQKGLEAIGQAPALALALAELDLEPYRKAQAKNEDELRANPTDATLLRTREKILKKVNSLELALYRQKVEHDPSDRALRFELGVRLERAGQVEDAIRELQAVRSDARLHGQAHYHLGHCFKKKGNWPLSQRNFEEALKSFAPNEEALRKEVLYELANGYADVGDLPRAIELALDLADLDFTYRDIGQRLEEWQRAQQQAKPVKPR